MTKKISTFLLIAFFSLGLNLFLAGNSKAQCPSDAICLENPLSGDTFEAVVNSLINFIFGISLALVPLMIVIGGVLFVTAGGNETQVTQAKKIILLTVVGFSILLLSKGIMSLIESILKVK